MYYVADGGNLIKATDYSTLSFNGTTITADSSNATSVTNAARLAEYESSFAAKNLTQLEDELWYITQNVTADLYNCGDNLPPYVTTNPRFDVTKDTNEPPNALQWLTSDGVSKDQYNGSAAYNIITGINAGDSDKKRYQNTGLDAEELTAMDERLQTNMTTIRSASTCTDAYGGEDFPVLIVNDISTADALVNGYIKLLTNTSYNFACGYRKEGFAEPTDSSIYNVDISKWLYNPTSGKFELQEGEAALKCLTNTGFRINANDLDNPYWQISLVDVQFYDPTGTGRIAYHLYVPVVVKKMLFYTVDLKAAPTTTYKLDAYPNVVQNILENLGNPITYKLTYTYQQTASVWEAAINSGENVYRNYDKILHMVNFNINLSLLMHR